MLVWSCARLDVMDMRTDCEDSSTAVNCKVPLTKTRRYIHCHDANDHRDLERMCDRENLLNRTRRLITPLYQYCRKQTASRYAI